MTDKPKQWSAEYASVFQDQSVVAAYQYRPTYPPQTFAFLLNLIPATATARTVLDAGCGTGFVARAIAPFVEQVDAVDISEAMIAEGRALPDGQRANIRWIAAPIETAPLHGPYALIVAAASLHWMDWEVTLPRMAAHLVSDGLLALVEDRGQPSAWDGVIAPIVRHYSMNTDFVPYTMLNVVEELERRQLFQLLGNHETAAVPFQQPVDAWIESFHARNGFSRDRMGVDAAQAFDEALRTAIAPYCPHGVIEHYVTARILWGTPLAPSQS